MFTKLAPVPYEIFNDIIRELEAKPIPVNRYRLKAGAGRSAAFGFVNKRCVPTDISRLCWQRPKLYKMLLDFGLRYCPLEGWNAITLNQGYQASPHKDRGNKGLSYLVAFGDYQGGQLQIHEGDASGVHDIRYQPILFDGKNTLHSVLPFQGSRYSLVYYTLEDEPQKKLSQYTPFQDEDGKWKLNFADGEGKNHILTQKCGLSHPKTGRKKDSS